MLFISLIHSADMLYSLLSEKTKALDYLVFNKLLHYIPFLCSLFSCTQKLCLDFLFHCTFFHWNELKYPSFSADLGLWHFACILVGAGCFCPVCLCSSINHAFLILLIIYTSFTFILAPSLLLEYLVFCLTFSLLWRTLFINPLLSLQLHLCDFPKHQVFLSIIEKFSLSLSLAPCRCLSLVCTQQVWRRPHSIVCFQKFFINLFARAVGCSAVLYVSQTWDPPILMRVTSL